MLQWTCMVCKLKEKMNCWSVHGPRQFHISLPAKLVYLIKEFCASGFVPVMKDPLSLNPRQFDKIYDSNESKYSFNNMKHQYTICWRLEAMLKHSTTFFNFILLIFIEIIVINAYTTYIKIINNFFVIWMKIVMSTSKPISINPL